MAIRNQYNSSEVNCDNAQMAGADLHNVDLRRASFKGTNLTGANLEGVDARGAYFKCVDADGAMFQNANLGGAHLSKGNYRGADFKNSYLANADLSYADFYKADFRGAELMGVNLYFTSLEGANLRGASLPSPQMVLNALWEDLSEELTIELMRYDAASHPDPESFWVWAKGGPCPYTNCHVQRAANFKQDRYLYHPGPSKGAYELMMMVLKEKARI